MTHLYSGRLAIFQSCAVDDRRLGAAAFRVLACLGTYSDEHGWCRPSQTTIGERLGVSQQAVSKQIRTLARLGYLEIRERHNSQTGAQLPHWYRLILDYNLSDEHRRKPLPADPPDETPQPEVVPGRPTPGASQPEVVPPTTPRGCGAHNPMTLYERPNERLKERKDIQDDSVEAEREPAPISPLVVGRWRICQTWLRQRSRARPVQELAACRPVALADDVLTLRAPSTFLTVHARQETLATLLDEARAAFWPELARIELVGP